MVSSYDYVYILRMKFSYKFKRRFLRILKEYEGKSYHELLAHEYPINDLVTTEDDVLDIEVVLLEEHDDFLLLGLIVTSCSSKRICCNSISRTFAVYNKLIQ